MTLGPMPSCCYLIQAEYSTTLQRQDLPSNEISDKKNVAKQVFVYNTNVQTLAWSTLDYYLRACLYLLSLCAVSNLCEK